MQGVLSRASFRRPPLSGQKTFTVMSLHISTIHARKRCIAKKLILAIRAIMIGHQIDSVACDFNGTAWRCSNRDNIRTTDEAFADCALPTPLGPPTHCGDPDRFQTSGLTFVGSLNHLIQIGIGRCACVVLSPSHAKLSACVQPIKAATMRHGSTWISSIGATPNHTTKNLTDEFCSKSVLRHVLLGSRKGACSLRDRVTIRTRLSILCETCTSSRTDVMTFRVRIQ